MPLSRPARSLSCIFCAWLCLLLSLPLLAQEDESADSEAPAAAREAPSDSTETPDLPPRVTDPSIDSEELSLRLTPLSRDQLGAVAEKWFELYRDKTTELIQAQLAINAAEEAADVEKADAGRAHMLTIGAEREVMGHHFASVLDAWESKGGNADEIRVYRNYRAAVLMEQTRTADLKTVWQYFRSWLFSSEGGLKLLVKFATFIIGLIALLALARIVAHWARRGAQRSPHFSRLLENFVEFAVFWLCLAIGLLMLLALLGINVTPLFALIGGASFVAAFAMQNTLGNLASGLMIMFNRPFDEGDFVDIGGVAGTVKSVSMMSTTVITPDNQVIIVPNSNVWGNVITNTTTATRRVDMTFGIGYDDNIETAQRVLEETVRNHPKVLRSPEPVIRVAELAASSVNFIVRPWVMGEDYWEVYWDMTRRVKEAFDANGISIPFPQQDVNVRGGQSYPPGEAAPEN